jgi:hypothetical protein
VDARRDLLQRAHAFHYESRAVLNAPVEVAFDYLDDFKKLSAHMEKSSGMMLGSKMTIETDGGQGRAVGSRVRMHGAMMGMKLALEEVVTERKPPIRKAWETLDSRLLVIGNYRLGFELDPKGASSSVCVFIDYDLPASRPARWLGALFGRLYARWCTGRMASDAVRHFSRSRERAS